MSEGYQNDRENAKNVKNMTKRSEIHVKMLNVCPKDI